MSRKPVDWEALNTYVDGELDADSSAAVAEAVADDPELARQISLITRLKAATAGSPARRPHSTSRNPP